MQKRSIIEQMNAFYEKQAPLHDKLMGYTDNARMEQLLAPLIKRFENCIAGQEVLEIACGTGNWTQVLAKRTRSVLATDISPAALDIARSKSYGNTEVTFRIADAYALENVPGTFTAAFAADWWSHIPKSNIVQFVEGVHRKLCTGAKVVFIDMMPSESLDRMFSHYDNEANLIHKRTLPDGQQFYVVKNFPTEEELRDVLDGLADDIEYYEHWSLRRWVLTYTFKSIPTRDSS